MGNYYFLGSLLPDLHLDEKPDIGFVELNRLVHDNLSAHDFAKTITIRNYFDIYNLRAYWKDLELNPVGNLDANAIEEALITKSGLPPYVFDYLDKYESKEERLHHFPELLATFFQKEIQRASGAFLLYLTLERELRLILLAYRAKKLGRDVVKELQYEDPEDEFVAQIIAQKDAVDYEPPEKYADFKQILNDYYSDPILFQKAYYSYLFRKIDEIIDVDSFATDRILAYMIKLIVVEKWQSLDKEKGLEIVDSILKEPS